MRPINTGPTCNSAGVGGGVGLSLTIVTSDASALAISGINNALRKVIPRNAYKLLRKERG